MQWGKVVRFVSQRQKLIMIQSYKQKVEQELKAQPLRQIRITARHPKLLNTTVELSPKQTLVELKQYLSETTALFLYENYHFECRGKQLPQHSEVDVLLETDEVVDVVLDSFDERTSRHHVRQVQRLIANPVMWAVLSSKDRDHHKDSDPEPLLKLDVETHLKPDFLNCFLSRGRDIKPKQPLGFLNFSGYSPPTAPLRLCGDLAYLHLKTLQGDEFHLTAGIRGFYVNCSTLQHFDSSPNPQYPWCFSNLLDLLNRLSPQFKSIFQENAEQVVLTEVERMVITSSYKSKRMWLQMKPPMEHRWNAFREVEDTNIDNSPIKDWNEMLQSQATLPATTQIQRLNKAKTMIKVYNQFVAAAVQGAKALVQGRLTPLNPLDDKLQHIYISNSIFYSIAQQTPFDFSQQKGLEATPSVTAINTDLRNLSTLMSLQIPQLHVLHMVLIQYRGHRVIAQCIIPGILSAEQLQCSQYGSIDDGKTIATNKDFESLMVQVCSKLGLDGNVEFLDGRKERKRIAGSYEIKGILGSDKRKYILDLMRLSPRDYNYLDVKNYCCVLRPQLIAQYKLSKQSKQFSNVLINVNLQTGAQMVRTSQTPKQQQLLQSMSNFLKKQCIPLVIRGLGITDHKYLSDSKGVISVFHKYGVNCRYLGQVLRSPLLSEHLHVKVALQRVLFVKSAKHLFRMAMRQTSPLYLAKALARLLNCLFGTKKQREMMEGALEIDQRRNGSEDVKKRRKKKKGQEEFREDNYKCVLEDIVIKPSKYLTMKPSEVWNLLRDLSKARYQYKFPQDYCFHNLPFNKLAALRDLCLSVGLVIQRKSYSLLFQNDNPTDLPFQPQNILDTQAISKHIPLRNKQTASLIQRADGYLSKLQIQQAIELYNSAVQYMVGLYGGMSDQIATVHHKIATVYYKLGDYDAAIMCERSSLELLEALHGEDHVLTLESYSNLAIFYFSKVDKDRTVYYLFKNIYLSSFAFGETYPLAIVNRLHLAAVYQELEQYQLAIMTLMDTINGLIRVYGRDNVNTAVCYQALANLHYQISDLRQAIQFQQISHSIFKKVLKQNDGRLSESSSTLTRYKQLLTHKRIRDDNSFKKSSREEMLLPKQHHSFERGMLLGKLQLAKWNSRMGFKR